MARTHIEISGAEAPVAATATETTPENIVNAEAAQGAIVQLTGPEVISARLDEQTIDVLQQMGALSGKLYVRGFEDPAYSNGMRKVENATAGEVTWLGRWFLNVGGSYHPVAVKVLKKGSIVAQAHQVVPKKDRDGNVLTNPDGSTQYREIASIMFENTEQEQAFNKLCSTLPEYLVSMGII
jgi:hypothetical protein